MTLRPIKAIDLPDVIPQMPPTAVPELTFINPADVIVDEKYQRSLSIRSIDLIAKIVGGFDWRKWRPPVCVYSPEGLKAIDGQHSLIAACSHPGIDQVPVLVVSASTLAEEAATFIGVNSDRLAVTKRQLHAAGVTAGDPLALTTQALCDRLGVRILTNAPNNRTKYAPRDTCAVSVVTNMVERIGIELAEVVLKVLADAACAPIKEVHLKAAEQLLIDPEFNGQITPEALTESIVALGEAGEREGRIFAATHGVPQWRGLASVWFSKRKKPKGGPRVTLYDATAGKFQPAPKAEAEQVEAVGEVVQLKPNREPTPLPGSATQKRIIDRRHRGPVPLGEPEPGRSALDERRRAQA